MHLLRLLLLLLPLTLQAAPDLWDRGNLDAWCIVPFDAKKRTPAQRAEMVVRLGLKKVAYDWRDQHVAEFEDEILQYQKHGIEFFAFWGEHPKAFELFAKFKLHPQIWLMAPNPEGATNEAKVKAAAEQLLPVVERTRKLGCPLALYNHGGWNGEPENMAAISEYLRKNHAAAHVGIVYNFHHGHAHIADFARHFKVMQPYLLAVNLNGMEAGGDGKGRKILHLGEGDRELEMMRIIEQSGWRGPVGIIDHREETDSEVTLRNNLLGLDWLRKELVKPGSGGAKPKARSGIPVKKAALQPGKSGMALDAAAGGLLLQGNDAWRTAPLTVEAWAKLRDARAFNVVVASDPKASSEHWELYSYAGTGDFSVFLPGKGGEARSGVRITDDVWHHLAMVLERERVRLYVDGKLALEKPLPPVSGTVVAGELGIGRTVEPGIGCNGLVDDVRISRGVRDITAAPEAALPRDAATLELFSCDELPQDATASLPEREPRNPAAHPLHTHPVNRERIYDFYAKQARDWRANPVERLPQFPGLDSGAHGHWGNQNEETWRDGRWNEMDCGPCMAGVFQSAGRTIPKAVCVRLGETGEISMVFDPTEFRFQVIWQGGFLKFSDNRHGLLGGLQPGGKTRSWPRFDGDKPGSPPRYLGYYRYEKRTIFAARDGDRELLSSMWWENRTIQELEGEELRGFTKGGPAQWPEILETQGTPGTPVSGWPYVVDTLTLPFENPWKSLLFIGGHDFFSNGDIALCTMTGDAWRVSGVDATLSKLRWKRMAAGLHQPLGLVVVEDKVCVLGRDQITRLHDLNGDGEADFYECLTNDFETPTGGHDYLCGLERDASGSFYTASGKDGLMKITPGRKPEIIATGFRNPDGLGLAPDGTLTVPYSEGEWTPTSAIAQITPGGYYGYPGPRPGAATLPPLLWLPRGMDNSAGGQTWVPDDRWGPLKGQMIHLSYGTGTHFLVLRQRLEAAAGTDGATLWQGAAVPLPGDFRSGAHRARFSPHDGQLYVSGMTGWGTYTPDDGCLHRVRYTGGPVQLPVAFEARDNGVLLTFSDKLDASAASTAVHFAQCWDYRYSQAYGSKEYSLRQPGSAGHDVLEITSAHITGDGTRLFLEIPQLQPAGQIHLVVQPWPGVTRELFLTAHQIAPPFTEFAGYKAVAKLPRGVAAVSAPAAEPRPVKWEQGAAGRALALQTAGGLQFAVKELRARAGERLSLALENPDVIPHNWVLLQPGTVERVGKLADQLIAAPDAFLRHYTPETPDVICHTRLVQPLQSTVIHFNAPAVPGRYPFLCTFPGHWALMRGELIVE